MDHDINVTGVWSNGITGKGVVIAVVDDGMYVLTTPWAWDDDCDYAGLEHSNSDIKQNYVSCSNYPPFQYYCE